MKLDAKHNKELAEARKGREMYMGHYSPHPTLAEIQIVTRGLDLRSEKDSEKRKIAEAVAYLHGYKDVGNMVANGETLVFLKNCYEQALLLLDTTLAPIEKKH